MRSSLLTHLVVLFAMFLVLAASTSAQYQDRALERARSVKMLSDDREAVRKILYDFNLDDSDETSDEFSFGEIGVEATYSSGGCDEDEEEIWNVAAGNVVKLEVWARSDWKRNDLKINLASFEREQMYSGNKHQLIYHSKREGVAVELAEDDVDRIIFFPPIGTNAKPCKTKYAEEFVGLKSWFGSKRLEDRFVCNWVNGHANVTGLDLSHTEISAVTAKQIDVATTAVDPEYDILTYNYTVTGGRIIGSGVKVQWDLTGVRPGTYTITAGVDDGAGVVGQTKSMTIVVR